MFLADDPNGSINYYFESVQKILFAGTPFELSGVFLGRNCNKSYNKPLIPESLLIHLF